METKSRDNQMAFDFLLKTADDNRREIEQRITQRDNFSIQFIVTSGALLSLSLLEFEYAYFLILLWPLISLFFTVQIKYSYVIHNRIHYFLVNNIEPELAKIVGFSNDERINLCWETYCNRRSELKKAKTPGIREGFFDKACYVIPLISIIVFDLLLTASGNFEGNRIWFHIASIVYLVILILINIILLNKFKKENE